MEQEVKPVAERKPDPAPRDDVRVAALSRCPFCHADAGVAASRGVCAACLARHHEACWTETGRCASCGHTVRLELPQPRPRSLAPLLAVVIALLAGVVGLVWTAYEEARAREVAASFQRHEVEARLAADRATAAEASRRHQDYALILHTRLREAQAEAAKAADTASEASERARTLDARLNTAQSQLREAELRAYTADARAQAAARRVAQLEERLAALQERLRLPAEVARWDRNAARVTALAAIARAMDAAGTNDLERARLAGARERLLRRRDGPPESFLARQPALLMFPDPTHPEFAERTTSALAVFGQSPDDALSCAYVGHVRLARGDFEGGRVAAEGALDLDPTRGLAWLVRAQARLALGDAAGAADDAVVGEALDDGRSCWSLYTRATIHAARGEHAQAAKLIELLRALGLVDGGLGLARLLEDDPALLPRPR